MIRDKGQNMSEFSLPDSVPFLKQDVVEIKAWLQSISANNSGLPQHFNWWLGLGEVAYSKAFQAELPNLEWAEVAITAYENVNRYSPNGCDSCMVSAMMLRARLISTLGTRPDDEILDSQVIIDWFLEKLPMLREEAENKIKLPLKELYDRYPKDMIELRKIKNRLNVLRVLYENGFQFDEELIVWLNMQDKLP
jgi:hypothetical protein